MRSETGVPGAAKPTAGVARGVPEADYSMFRRLRTGHSPNLLAGRAGGIIIVLMQRDRRLDEPAAPCGCGCVGREEGMVP
jgi:hypothetical protein